MNTASENGFCPSSSSAPLHNIRTCGIRPGYAAYSCGVSPVLAASHLQPAIVPPNHRHPLACTPYIYSVFDTVEVRRKIEQAVTLKGQNQQKPVLFPDIRSSAQVAQMVADKYPKMEAAKDGSTERNQPGNGNNNKVSKNDYVLVLTQMHRKINSPSVSDLDCNKRQEGCNQIPREVRPGRIQVERMGNCQNHCSMQ